MTIDEAIKELQKDVPPIPVDEYSLNTQAKALGIEALKRERDGRGTSYNPTWYPLPGETES